MDSKIWLIGAGHMSEDYAKVLQGQNQKFLVIGRGTASADQFQKKTGCFVITGGFQAFLTQQPDLPPAAIVSVGIEQLCETTLALLNYGVKRILLEKPGGLNFIEITQIDKISQEKNAQVLIAYNRRFYSSVQKAQEIINQDRGVISFHFEFTEWSHEIKALRKAEAIKQRWFLANSSHVVDLAFFLGGTPKKIQCYTAGGLDWHSSASIFTGAGITKDGALFSYHANWEAPGRWGVELLTSKHRLVFRPLEQLQIQQTGSVSIELLDLNDSLDHRYKAGLYRQVEQFLIGHDEDFCNIQKQLERMKIYYQMANYDTRS